MPDAWKKHREIGLVIDVADCLCGAVTEERLRSVARGVCTLRDWLDERARRWTGGRGLGLRR